MGLYTAVSPIHKMQPFYGSCEIKLVKRQAQVLETKDSDGQSNLHLCCLPHIMSSGNILGENYLNNFKIKERLNIFFKMYQLS